MDYFSVGSYPGISSFFGIPRDILLKIPVVGMSLHFREIFLPWRYLPIFSKYVYWCRREPFLSILALFTILRSTNTLFYPILSNFRIFCFKWIEQAQKRVLEIRRVVKSAKNRKDRKIINKWWPILKNGNTPRGLLLFLYFLGVKVDFLGKNLIL